MMCYSPTGYIMFSLKKLKFHRGQRPGMRAGGRITQTPPSSCSVFLWVLFYKNQIVLHHGGNSFLFWHLYEIHTLNNNLNDEETRTSHLINVIASLQQKWYSFYVATFLWLKRICLREKNQYQRNLSKACYMKKPFRHSKI